MSILDELFCKYGTDKSSKGHNFGGIYHAALGNIRFEILKVLEIGIFGVTSQDAGASLKAWAEYFPNARIYGADLFDYSFLNTGRITTIVADQGIIDGNLERIVEIAGSDFDLIIDDGSHLMHHQQISLGYMFKHLKPGGYYIIEDIHTSYHDICNPTGTEYNTTLMLEILKHTGTLQSDHITETDKKYIEKWIESCEIHKITPFASETAILKKHRNV